MFTEDTKEGKNFVATFRFNGAVAFSADVEAVAGYQLIAIVGFPKYVKKTLDIERHCGSEHTEQ